MLQAEVGSTVTATVINLLKNMVGAGLLNVCVAFQYASVMGGLLVMLFSAFVCTGGPLKSFKKIRILNSKSFLLALARLLTHWLLLCKDGGPELKRSERCVEARTFRELWRVAMGKDTEKILGQNQSE